MAFLRISTTIFDSTTLAFRFRLVSLQRSEKSAKARLLALSPLQSYPSLSVWVSPKPVCRRLEVGRGYG